jgi:predicted Rossmann fold nucleotide-binding protein DprA/Smf involved in DNA uptake
MKEWASSGEGTPALCSIALGDLEYPQSIEAHLGGDAPPRLHLLGDVSLLRCELLAFFCSVRCPGALVLQAYDMARALREAGAAVVGGFHTPMERDCLDILLRGGQPVVVCPARGLERMRLSGAQRAAVREGRLLLVSPFGASVRRPTAETAAQRNRLVVALAGAVFVAHAAAGSKTEAMCRDALAWGKPVFTLDSPDNAHLRALGATPVRVEDAAQLQQWAQSGAITPAGAG